MPNLLINDTFHCCGCGENFTNNLDNDFQAYIRNEICYCPQCAFEVLEVCAICASVIDNSNRTHHNSNWYHHYCFHNEYFTCANCRLRYHNRYGHYVESVDGVCCESCCEDLEFSENNCDDFAPNPLNFDNNTFKHLRYNSCFGIELEINDKDLPYQDIKNKTIFGSKEDGSLDCGSEFYSPILQGDKGYFAIKKFCDTVGNPNIGMCTGYHLHLDAINLYLKDIQKIWLLYRIFEGVLYHMLPYSRRNNRYCKASNMNINTIYNCSYRYLEDLWYNQDDEDEDRTGHYNPTRYFGFNLHSYFYQSTIEIRYHSGTADFNKIMNWIKIHQSLVKFALSHSLEKIYQLNNLNKYNTNYTKIRYLFKTVISNNTLWNYYKQRFTKFSSNNYEYGLYNYKG